MTQGLINRAEAQKRHKKKHNQIGLCRSCSRKLSDKSISRCDYHLEKQHKYNKIKQEKELIEELIEQCRSVTK